jgi:hypothetical protein
MPENAVRGYAWFVRRGPGFRSDPNDVPWGGTPVPRFAWPVAPGEPGVHNHYGNLSYVALTETPLPPEVKPGWEVEPAALDTDFDATGARLIREAGFRETPHGRIPECVFEVAGP